MKIVNIEGKYATAKVFTVDDESIAIDQHSKAQIQLICDNKVSEDSMIRVMPDVHAGKVGPIGLTMQFNNKRIMPNLIGNDIGCGIESYEIFPKTKLTVSDFQKLDIIIRDNIPAGSSFHKKPQPISEFIELDKLYADINIDDVSKRFGTLGGGNHFIEVDTVDGRYFITIHSGSRNLGSIVDAYYKNEGQKVIKSKEEDVPYDMTYLEDDLFDKYLHDVAITENFAKQNRSKIVDVICSNMKWKYKYFGGGPHNTVKENEDDLSDYVYSLHKGANSTISEYPIIIPINMKDGIIIAKGKYNFDWNNSCPHGSGRLYKRSDVSNIATLSSFKKEMEGIYSTSIRKDTLDESPMAYRRINDIKEAITDTVDIIGIATPIYSFKAGGK